MALWTKVTDKIRVCRNGCGTTYDTEAWQLLSNEEKWDIRRSVPFTTKRRNDAAANPVTYLETVCKKCRTKLDIRYKARKGLNSQGKVPSGRPRGKPVEEKPLEYPEGSPVFEFFFRVKPTPSSQAYRESKLAQRLA